MDIIVFPEAATAGTPGMMAGVAAAIANACAEAIVTGVRDAEVTHAGDQTSFATCVPDVRDNAALAALLASLVILG